MEERELIRAVLAAFRGSTGLPASVARHLGRAAEIDAIVTVAGRALAVEVKRNVDRLAVVPTAKTQLDRAQVDYRLEGGLLVTEYLSLNILDACRLHGLYAADLSGNAFVEWDGLLVFVAGRPRHRVKREPLGWSAAAVKLGMLLLAAPEGRLGSQRVLAHDAGVALGSVGPTLKWFRDRGFLVVSDGDLVVRRRDQLLDEWALAYGSRLRPRLRTQRFASTPSTPTGWWRSADPRPAEWSGEVAAAVLQGEIRPSGAVLYVDAEERSALLRRLVREHRLVAEANGPIEILDRFWSFPSVAATVVPWPLVYADLLRLADPRSSQAAIAIREQSIGT